MAASRSKVWEFFYVNEQDSSNAVCKTCQAKVSRGGSNPRNFTATYLTNHLKRHHPTIYEDKLKLDKEKLKVKDDIKKLKSAPTLLSASKIPESQPKINQLLPWSNNNKEHLKLKKWFLQ